MNELFLPDETLSGKISAVMREAGKLMLSARNISEHVESKAGDKNYFTEYDVAVQKFLYAELERLLPSAGFIGEEGDNHHTELLDGGICWIVDPIDGTNNFISGYNHSAVSVALSDRGELTAGYVYNPYSGEFFSAVKGGGAALNGRRIRVSERGLGDGMVGFGTSPYKRQLADRTFRILSEIYPLSRDLRRSGSAALDICCVACGRLDVFFEGQLSPWDYAAGSVILTEAGGVIKDFKGRKLPLDRPSTAFCANKLAAGDAFGIISGF